MVTEEWQIGFAVKGLRAPDEALINNNVLIKGTKHDDAYVFLKTTIRNEQEKDDLSDNMKSVLKNITEIYGLITHTYTEVLSGVVAQLDETVIVSAVLLEMVLCWPRPVPVVMATVILV